MDIPLPFGLVHGNLYAGVGDTNDAGRAPDMLGLTGTATFTATVDKEIVNTTGSEAIIVPQAIVADVTAGVLSWLGAADVPLTANLDAFGVTLGWQWKVSFNLTNPATTKQVVLKGWNLDVKVYNSADSTTITQLSAQAPVLPPVGNVQITKGPKGDKGDKGDPSDAVEIEAGARITISGSGTPSDPWIISADATDLSNYYTKTQSDGRFQPVGSYAAAGDLDNVFGIATGAETHAQAALTQLAGYTIWVGTQAAYDAISSKDAHTLYHVSA